jgi:hypothetical protein
MDDTQRKRQKIRKQVPCSAPGLHLLTEEQLVIATASTKADPASVDDPVIFLLTTPTFDPISLAEETPHPLDVAVTFEEETHTYAVQYEENGPFSEEGIISTSGFVHGYFGHFDADVIIPKMRRGRNFATSKYADMTDIEIKTSWEMNGARASTRGTLLHFLLECHMNGFDLAKSEYAGLEDVQSYFRWRKEYFEPAGLVPFRTELRFSTGPDLRLTGTADLLAIREDHGPPTETGGVLSLHLLDWKFSKGVQSENRFGSGSGPCKKMPDCNGSHYSLQQNIYRWFIETYHGNWKWRGHEYTSVKIIDMRLVVFHRNHGNCGLMMEIRDDSDVVRAMLEDRRAQILRDFGTIEVSTPLLRPVFT